MRAVVTGGSGLIGRAIATALAREGYDVVVHYHRSAETAAETVEAIVAADGAASAVGADLRTAEGIQRLLAGQDELHLLVNALGAYAHAPLAETTDEMLDEMLALNYLAPLRVTRTALPSLRAARGQVVQLLDIAASQPWREHAAYASSKAAAAHMIRCLALELAPQVRVTGVAPGLVAGATGVAPDTFADLEERIPGGRAVTPEEVAQAVLLLSGLPRSVTGQIIAVDGGRSLGRRRIE